MVGEFETGEEPEGVLATPDGKLVFVASEAANLVHVIDVERQEVVKDILVATRPRRFALTPDGKELWVSAELAGQVDIIDMARLSVIGSVSFRPKGFRREEVTPVDLLITRDGKRAFVALGRANHVAVVDVPGRRIEDYILVGHRPWGLALSSDEKTLYVANGLSDDVTIIEAERLKVVTSVPVGQVPYGFLIDDR
jgi:YVTN family beta-propeller protein